MEEDRVELKEREMRYKRESELFRKETLRKDEELDTTRLSYEKQLAALKLKKINMIEFIGTVSKELRNLMKWSCNFNDKMI